MLYVFRVDIGETYTFETDLAFQDVKTLKSTIEREHAIAPSKQILIISGGELLDDDAVQVCMKTRETCAGTEENPIYLLDKSHLERPRPLQLPLTSNSISILDNVTVEKWLAMPSTYETIVQRADTAQTYNRYAQKIVENCERFIRDQQAQYQGWMAVIANIEDTLSSFLLNRNSFDRSYQNYLSERSSYLELFQNLPHAIETLHQLKLPNKLISLIENSNLIYHKSTVSSSTSSSSISLAATTSTNLLTQNENDIQVTGDMSLFEWITAQLANMNVDDIINGCTNIIDECTDELLSKMNNEIDDLSKKISNHELKHMIGIEERFALLQNELTSAKQFQHEQKDCAEYLVSQRQRFSSNVGNQRDFALIKDISGIHSQNLSEIAKRHNKLIEIEKRVRKSKQDIIDQLHRRFKNMMLLQRHLVDYDAKQSLYIHKLNRTKKTMSFLYQLNQAPNLYYSFLNECVRRKQYSNIFNQFSETIHHESKNVHNDEVSKREQFIKQYEPHFLFNLLPTLKVLPSFFIKEPLLLLDTNLPDITLAEVDQIFDKFPEVKQQTSESTMIDPSINLASLIRCTQTFHEEKHPLITTPLSVFIPLTTTIVHEDTPKQLPSPTNSSSRSTVVRSQSSSDVESPGEQVMTQTLSEQTVQNNFLPQTDEEQSNIENEQNNDEISSEKENSSMTKSSSDIQETSPSTTSVTTNTTSNNEEEDDYIQCSLEAVYTSTEMAVSPPQRPCVSQQTDNEYTQSIINEFHLLKNQCEQTKTIQHDLILNYHETISKVITSLQQSNHEHQKQIELLQSEINNHIQDNETLKMQYEISEQLKQELTIKYSTLETNFDEFRRTSDIETSQIVKALQSDFEFELEKVRSEHQDTLNQMKSEQEKKQILTTTIEIQTDEYQTLHKQTSVMNLLNNQDQSTETIQILFNEQFTQTSDDDQNDETSMRRLTTKDQQKQFNLAIQRAVQNATSGPKKQIVQLEQQLADKRIKILKLKECIKKLQNFYTLSSTPPPLLPSVTSSMITSSTTDDEQQLNKDDEDNTPDETISTTPTTPTTTTTTTRQAFLKRSEPISMPSTFIVQSMLAAGNAASSPKTEQPISATVNSLLMETCFKSSPGDSSAAVELYTPFAASPPNNLMHPLSPQTSLPISSISNSSQSISNISRLSTNSSPQATPIAFFTVNRSDHVIIYFDQTYQHYMIYTHLPTLHFIHSDCYESFNIQQRQNLIQQQQINTTTTTAAASSGMDSTSGDNGNSSTNIPTLINTSMMNSTMFGINGLNLSTTPLLGQVTDKEYCQAKKPNNRFNVPLSTKFYRVRVKPWKPTISSS
ncbi:unnamed protein product [Adineta steineri]|uniref:Autophagy protein ATG17-like domain-containing protein n=1 Tax=Adineta steineri TaxID=433720 RepID=A0A815M7R5_9BILA|nr:unnamed protein product [Adineta steineri]